MRAPLPSICYIAPDVAIPFPSGASVHVTELASSLGKMGHDVHVISRRVRKDDLPIEQKDGYTVHRVYRWIAFPQKRPPQLGTEESRRTPTRRLYYLYLRTIFALYVSLVASRIIKSNGLDAIIERETSFGAGGLASIFTGRPLVLEIIGPRFSRLSAGKSRRILYYTESMLRDWVDRKKCLAVPAGVNIRLFQPDESGRAMRYSFGFRDMDFVVGYVGSFQSWHGVDTLLEAASGLKGRYPHLRLFLVGPYFQSYESIAKSLGMASICKFTGPVPYASIPGFINMCDTLVAPYNPLKDEIRRRYGIGWPLKILEYMACGKPVVSTKVPPVNEIIDNEVTGFLVSPGNAEQLSIVIARLADDPCLSLEVSSRARSSIDSKYSWSSVAELFSRIVNEAASKW